MYAVIESGGKQYRVGLGDRIKVESLRAEPGEKVDLGGALMIVDEGEIQVGTPQLDTAVEATVVGHGRAPKVRIFKLRRRQNSRQQAGHRQHYTELEITGIGAATVQPTPPPAPKDTAEPDRTEAVEPAQTAADDLTQINGIGPVIVEKLGRIGITSFEQIANFTDADIERIEDELEFKGRIERDDWVGQAQKFLEG